MYEIEMKAHVENYEKVCSLINSFATFCENVEKHDTYYRAKFEYDGKKGHTDYRVRKLINKDTNETKFLFTCKIKHIETTSDNMKIEVNTEDECVFDKEKDVYPCLSDFGAKFYFEKQKIVKQWEYKTDAGSAKIELCTVPPIGDFLEIEILSETKNTDQVKQAILKIFEKCEIDKSAFESKSYETLLRSKKRRK